MNEFIYGKDQTFGVVSVEVSGQTVYLFKNDGTFETRPYKYWMLLSESLGTQNRNVHRLEGDLYYKYLAEFNQKWDLFDVKKQCEKDEVDYKIFYNDSEQAMIRHGITSFKGLKFSDVSVLAFDIETTGLKQNDDSKVLIITNTFRDRAGNVSRKMFCIDEYEQEDGALMIDEWCDWVREVDPDVMCGHNIFMYDLPYLQHCRGTSLKLGRANKSMEIQNFTSYKRKDQSQTYRYNNCTIFGRQVIDTFFSSINYDATKADKYNSYKLESIIAEEGLEVENREHYDGALIPRNWHNPVEREKIKRYAMHDGDDALALFDLQMPAYFYYAQSIPRSLQHINNSASGGQINSFMVRSYIQYRHSIPKASYRKKYEGATSFGNPGIYSNVLKVDVASLYPSVMRVFKIYSPDKDPLKHFLHMVEHFTDERLENKKLSKETGDKYYRDLEQAQKIIINSAYGMLGTGYLEFNYPDGAAFVTQKGREILEQGIGWVQRKGHRLVNVDTDAFSYTKMRTVNNNEFEQDIAEINEMCPEGILWENDGMYKRVIVVKTKNYVLWNGDTITYKGSAFKDQKKEPALKEMLERFVKALLNGIPDQIPTIYRSYIREVLSMKDIKRWAVKKTVTNAVFMNDRPNEAKVRDAIGSNHVQEGDKIWIYSAVNGEKQVVEKGIPQFYKRTGLPKMEPNRVLRMTTDWKNDLDIDHYLERVYDTALIMGNVLDPTMFKNYALKKNRLELENITI